MRLSILRIASCAALLATTMAACNDAAGPERDLAAARARWAQRGPASYQLTVARSCECLPEMSEPVLVTVTNGAVEARSYERTGSPVEPRYAPLFPSVEGLFASIDSARQRGSRSLDVRYDPTLGYPVRIAVGVDAGLDGVVTSVTALRAR